MKTLVLIVALTACMAGCSGREAFEKDILGGPPASPPPATAAGSNVSSGPAERDLGTAPAPVATAPVSQPATAAPQPSVSTTVPQEPVSARQPTPYREQAAIQTPPAQTHSPYAAPPQTASPYANPQPAPVRQASGTPVAQGPAGVGTLVFQVGSFAHEANAVSLRDVLVTRGHESYLEQGQTPQGKAYYRVYAKMKGSEKDARATLIALGVSEPRLVSGAGVPVSSQQASAPQVSAGTASPPVAAASASVPAGSGKPVAGPGVISGPTGECHVDAERISTVGSSRADPTQPLMAQKAAAQNAKRNLLLCVDAYKRKQEKIPASIKMEGYLPDTLITYSSPAYMADGSVEVGASMAIRDVDAVAFTRVD
ncbi:MAG: SPOR domain-containing protein [Thermodesulfobacteriota bacterium]